MIVRNKKAIEREKKLLNDLLVRTGYTKPKTKFRYEFPDLSVRKTAPTTDKVGNGLAKKYGTCLLYTSPSPRDDQTSRMPSSA